MNATRRLRVLMLYAHPLPDSFAATLRDTLRGVLERDGHDVDLCDLYAEGFDPILSAEGRARYHDPARNRAGVETYVERLKAAQALVLCFPVWSFGFPAILKGFFDRVFLPGVSMSLDGGRPVPLLHHIEAVVGVATYGRPRRMAWWVGDPPRHLVTRYLRWFVRPGAPIRFLALYDMNNATPDQRERFAARVRLLAPATLGRAARATPGSASRTRR